MNFPNTYAVYDLETTGLNPEGGDEALEIGLILVEEGKVAMEKSWLLDINRPIPEKSVEITGITNELLEREGILPGDAWRAFYELAARRGPLVGHNISQFDNRFVKAARERHLISAPLNLAFFVDTAALYKGQKMGEEQQWYEGHMEYAKRILEARVKGLTFNLGEAFETLGGDPRTITAHRALGDCRMTNFVYRKLAGLPDLTNPPEPTAAPEAQSVLF